MGIDQRSALGLPAGAPIAVAAGAASSAATLNVGDPLPRFALLRPGVGGAIRRKTLQFQSVADQSRRAHPFEDRHIAKSDGESLERI